MPERLFAPEVLRNRWRSNWVAASLGAHEPGSWKVAKLWTVAAALAVLIACAAVSNWFYADSATKSSAKTVEHLSSNKVRVGSECSAAALLVELPPLPSDSYTSNANFSQASSTVFGGIAVAAYDCRLPTHMTKFRVTWTLTSRGLWLKRISQPL